MASGLLNGRGCYDSLQKCQDEAPLFLSIRHHGTSFVLEQRKKLVDPTIAHASLEQNFDAKVKEQFVHGALPVLRSIIKFVFLVFVFPFHFCFYHLPRLILEKLLNPVFAAIQKMVLSIIRPIVGFFQRIFRPIVVLCQKITAVYHPILSSINRGQKKCSIIFRRLKLQIYSVIFEPLKRVIRKTRGVALRISQKCKYAVKLVRAWTRLLLEYGFQLVRTQGEKRAPLKDPIKD